MLGTMRLDDRFLDRPGCGDELYLDSHFRASTWLATIEGLAPPDADEDDDLEIDVDIDVAVDADCALARRLRR